MLCRPSQANTVPALYCWIAWPEQGFFPEDDDWHRPIRPVPCAQGSNPGMNTRRHRAAVADTLGRALQPSVADSQAGQGGLAG